MGEPALREIERYGKQTPRKLKGNIFSLDTECTGFDPFNGARIFCYSLFSNKGESMHLPKTPRVTQWVMDLLNDPENVAVFQNGKFDLKMLTHEGWSLDDMKADYQDTLAMGVLMDELGDHSLGGMARRWLGTDAGIKDGPGDWCVERDKQLAKLHRKSGCEIPWPDKEDHYPCTCGMRRMNFSDVPSDILIPYAKWDAEYTLKLAYYLKTPIKRDFWRLYQTELDLIKCTIEMENRGLEIDMDVVDKLQTRARSDLRWVERRMKKVVGRDFIIKGTGSQKDLINVITKDLGWPIKRRTKKGNPQFDEFGLLSYLDPKLAHVVREDADEMPTRDYIRKFRKEAKRVNASSKQLFVPLMLKWRELTKMDNTYYEPARRQSVPTKNPRRRTLHGRFNSLTAITGRFSSSKPNLQNIPRILGPRQYFICRKGYSHYHYDFSQVEMRLYIHYAKDEKLREALLAGKDLHLQTATEIFMKAEDTITKEERKKAKSTNFGILYGSGAETLAETLTKMGIPTDKTQAKVYLERYHAAKPSCRRLMNKCKAELMRKGWIADEFGRRFRVPLRVSYKAINALIQGCSADIMKRAMARIWKYLKRNKCRSRIIMTIHDEIVVEIHKSEEKRLVPKIERMMEKDSPKFWIPITSDTEVTRTYWSDKK